MLSSKPVMMGTKAPIALTKPQVNMIHLAKQKDMALHDKVDNIRKDVERLTFQVKLLAAAELIHLLVDK